MLNAHIVSIGNELLIGDTINTNASWIGRFLTEHGFRVDEVRTVSDDFESIKTALSDGMKSADLVISTGGLGPTHDDITKKAVCDLFNSNLILNEEILVFIKKIFKKRGLRFGVSNRDQALVPDSCDVLFNHQGTAPGLWFSRDGSCLVVLPGVPHEMRYLMETGVAEKIRELYTGQEFRATRYFKTAGVAESTLSDEIVGDLGQYLSNGLSVAYLPSSSGVTIRISTEGETPEDAGLRLESLARFIRDRAGGLIYGEGRDLQLSKVLGDILIEKKVTLAVAESCTGGLVCNAITDVPGSSEYFLGGEIAYANQVKIDHLGVPEEDLEMYGAVSMQVALQMAKGIAEKLGADIGVSTTGIAGPGGGTEDKPVGTVWMGFCIGSQHFALEARFSNNRMINKERTVMVVLETLRRKLLDLDTLPYDLKPKQI